MYSRSPVPLNSDFEDQVTACFETEEELAHLSWVFKDFISARKGSNVVNAKAVPIFKKARDAFGHLKIGDEEESWRIDSFDIPDIPET